MLSRTLLTRALDARRALLDAARKAKGPSHVETARLRRPESTVRVPEARVPAPTQEKVRVATTESRPAVDCMCACDVCVASRKKNGVCR